MMMEAHSLLQFDLHAMLVWAAESWPYCFVWLLHGNQRPSSCDQCWMIHHTLSRSLIQQRLMSGALFVKYSRWFLLAYWRSSWFGIHWPALSRSCLRLWVPRLLRSQRRERSDVSLSQLMALDRSLRRSRIPAHFEFLSTDQPRTPGNLVSALSVLGKMQSQPQHFQFAIHFLHRLLWPETVPHLEQRLISGCIFQNCCVVACADLSLIWLFDYQDHFRNSWLADCQSDVSAPTFLDFACDSQMSEEYSNHFDHSLIRLLLLLKSQNPSLGLSNS